jgi:Protein of unknown function (DUF559)
MGWALRASCASSASTGAQSSGASSRVASTCSTEASTPSARPHSRNAAIGWRPFSRSGPAPCSAIARAGRSGGLIGARGPIEVTVPGASGRGRRGSIVVHTSACLRVADRAARAGIPVTSIPRTLLDLATTLSSTQLSKAFEEADRSGLLERTAVLQVLGGSAGHHGAGRLATLAPEWLAPSEGARTELERRFLRLCVQAGLPEPAMNVTLCGFEVDALWPRARLVVELDSYGFHTHRQAFERDRARDAALQLAGYRVIRVTWRRIDRAPRALVRC